MRTRFLLDMLYEQERADRAVLQCDHRWTVSGSMKAEKDIQLDARDDDDKKDYEAEEDHVLHRWTTEEDLSSQLAQTAAECDDVKDRSLSHIHSESTDSGIQSVGSDGSQEDDKKLSLIHRIFGGKMTTTYKCLTCCTESHHQNFFTDIHLAFPDTPSDSEPLTIQTLLQYYLAAEKLQGENCYHCDHCCTLQEAERTLQLTESPKHLLLTLLRFRFDRLLQRRGKITTKIVYPQVLDLPINNKTETYILYAVVIHSGLTLDGGHYYTLARSSHVNVNDVHNSTWYMFNDSQVSFTDFQSLIDLSKKYPTDTPYVLWYRRAEDSVSLSRPLPPHLTIGLKQAVDQDNLKFIREKFSYMSTHRQWPKKDDDDDGGTNHGESHFQDNTGSRFVF